MLQRIARGFFDTGIQIHSANRYRRIDPKKVNRKEFLAVASNGRQIALIKSDFLLVSRMLTAHPEDQLEYFSPMLGKPPRDAVTPENAAIAALLTYVQFALCLVIFAGLN